MIERALKQLQAAEPKQGDRLPRGGRVVPALSRTDRAPATDVDFQRVGNDIMKRTGSLTLGLGADMQGMPFNHPEMRAYGETVINLGQVVGNVAIDVSLANVFEMTVVGNTQVTFVLGDWPTNAYLRGGNPATGIDLPVTLLIDKQGGSLAVEVSVWAPKSTAPDLSLNGFYELGFAYRHYPGASVAKVRGYPIIVPPDEAP